ncbi:MAG: GNAT family N-acetyltransferase [Promethearchaeota archaeon]
MTAEEFVVTGVGRGELGEVVRLVRNSDPRGEVTGANSVLGFPLNEGVLEAKTFGDPDFSPDLFLAARSGGRVVGVTMGVRRPWKAGKGGVGWVKFIFVGCEYRGRGAGSRLLAEVERRLRKAGARVLEFGSSAPNYLVPGVPAVFHDGLEFLQKRGWRKVSERVNLGVEVKATPANDLNGGGSRPRLGVQPAGLEVSTVDPGDPTQVEAVRVFIREEFTESWEAESLPAIAKAGGAFCLVATRGKSGEVVGFLSMHGTNPGWLGPMGVKRGLRRSGVGGALVRRALELVAGSVNERVTIPWVSGENRSFYEKVAGAAVSARFWKFEKLVGA